VSMKSSMFGIGGKKLICIPRYFLENRTFGYSLDCLFVRYFNSYLMHGDIADNIGE